MSKETNFLNEKLDKILRELTVIKYLLGFIAVCVGIIFFFPQFAARVGEFCQPMQEWLTKQIGGILGFLFALAAIIGAAAYVLGRISPSLNYHENQNSPEGRDA